MPNRINQGIRWITERIRYRWNGDHIPQSQYSRGHHSRNPSKLPKNQLRLTRIKMCFILFVIISAIILALFGIMSLISLMVAWALILALEIYHVFRNIIYRPIIRISRTIINMKKMLKQNEKLAIISLVMTYDLLLLSIGVIIAYFITPFFLSLLAGSIVMAVPAIGMFLMYGSISLTTIFLLNIPGIFVLKRIITKYVDSQRTTIELTPQSIMPEYCPDDSLTVESTPRLASAITSARRLSTVAANDESTTSSTMPSPRSSQNYLPTSNDREGCPTLDRSIQDDIGTVLPVSPTRFNVFSKQQPMPVAVEMVASNAPDGSSEDDDSRLRTTNSLTWT